MYPLQRHYTLTAFLTASLIFVMSCSTSNTKLPAPGSEGFSQELSPPNVDFSRDISNQDPEELDKQVTLIAEKNSEVPTMRWWRLYQIARIWQKDNPNLSCLSYRDLANEEKFPLRSLALIRAHQLCGETSSDLEEVYPLKKFDLNPWIKEQALDLALIRAESKKDRNSLMHLAIEKSKASSLYDEKIKFLQLALTIAKEKSDPRYIREIEARLYRFAPRLNPNPKPENYSAIAYDYRRIRDFDSARRYYEKIINGSENIEEIFEALKGIRTSYKLEKKVQEYLNATDAIDYYLTEVIKKHPKYLEQFLEAKSMRIRAHWTEGNVAKAKEILDALIEKYERKMPLGHYYWLRSRIEEEAKNYPAALSWLGKAFQTKSNREFKEKVQWYQAWILRKLGDYPQAAEILSKLKDNSEELQSRYRFWFAMTLRKMNRDSEADEELAKIINEDSLGYYSLLAHRELKRPFTAPIPPEGERLPTAATDASLPYVGKRSQIQFQWLLSVGESELAKEVLKQWGRDFKRHHARPEQWKVLFAHYALAEDYLGLYNQLSALNREDRRLFTRANTQLLFPRPYHSFVKNASERFGVTPELIYAIMRQESAFNPRARSPADAFGLLQIIPQVAAKTAPIANVAFKEPTDLYDPQTNITVGSAYIRELWDKYNGQFILTVASYNASEHAIANWVKKRFNGDPLEFIEDIPYSETQDYVKTVLRNLILYKGLEENSASFPEWCLENIQNSKS